MGENELDDSVSVRMDFVEVAALLGDVFLDVSWRVSSAAVKIDRGEMVASRQDGLQVRYDEGLIDVDFAVLQMDVRLENFT